MNIFERSITKSILMIYLMGSVSTVYPSAIDLDIYHALRPISAAGNPSDIERGLSEDDASNLYNLHYQRKIGAIMQGIQDLRAELQELRTASPNEFETLSSEVQQISTEGVSIELAGPMVKRTPADRRRHRVFAEAIIDYTEWKWDRQLAQGDVEPYVYTMSLTDKTRVHHYIPYPNTGQMEKRAIRIAQKQQDNQQKGIKPKEESEQIEPFWIRQSRDVIGDPDPEVLQGTIVSLPHIGLDYIYSSILESNNFAGENVSIWGMGRKEDLMNGPIKILPSYIMKISQEICKRQNYYGFNEASGRLKQGLSLLKAEEGLDIIAQWFQANFNGEDFGISLLALEFGLRETDREHYKRAWIHRQRLIKASSAGEVTVEKPTLPSPSLRMKILKAISQSA